MALAATMLWEVRTTGSQTNGGGWKPGATGTDYSQQDVAQYALTGVTTAAADAICLHASAAADMVGNTCRIVSGTNFKVGWYEIVSVVVGVSFTLDQNCTSAAGALGVINVGGAFKLGGTLDDKFTEAIVAGNQVWMKSGTYTGAENISTDSAGTSLLLITWTGYTANRGDTCVGMNRPFFNGGAYNWGHNGAYHKFNNMRFDTTSGLNTFTVHAYSTVFNCKATQSGTVADIVAFAAASIGVKWIACEGSSRLGAAFSCYDSSAYACYAHDSKQGFKAPYGDIINCVIDTCQTGISPSNLGRLILYNSTIRNCLLGISVGTVVDNRVVNNIIADCVTGASAASNLLSPYWDYNCWSNNTTDVSNITKGSHDVTAASLLSAATAKGTDGATNAGGTVFTAASNPFGSVTTSDRLNITVAGTGATLGVYAISSVDNAGQLTLATSAGASKTGITYCIVKGTDFTLAVGSPCFNTGLKLGTDVGL